MGGIFPPINIIIKGESEHACPSLCPQHTNARRRGHTEIRRKSAHDADPEIKAVTVVYCTSGKEWPKSLRDNARVWNSNIDINLDKAIIDFKQMPSNTLMTNLKRRLTPISVVDILWYGGTHRNLYARGDCVRPWIIQAVVDEPRIPWL